MLSRKSVSPWTRYAAAILAVAVATLARWLVYHIEHGRAPFVLFIPAIIAAALYGGWGPGLLATLLCAIISVFWFDPIGSFAIRAGDDWLLIGIFVFVDLLVVWVCAAHRSSRAIAEQAVNDARAAGQRLAAMFEQSTAGIAQLDMSGKFILVNQWFCDLVGYSREEMLNLSMQDLTHPDDVQRNLDLIDRSAKSGGNYRVEKRYIRKDGSLVWISVSGNVIRDAEGKAQSVLGVVIDMTDRRRIEEALRLSEQEHRSFFEFVSVGLVHAEWGTGKFLKVNQKFCQMTGYSEDELLGMTFIELTHPDDRERDLQRYQAMIDGRSPTYTSEKRYLRKDGGTMWVHINAAAIRDANGKAIRTAAFVQDVTDRKRAEEAAHDAERRYRAIFEATRDGLIINAPDGTIIEANPAACEMHGYSYEEFVGIPSEKIIHRDDLPKFAQFVEIAGNGREFRSDARDIRRDGTVFPVEVIGTSFVYNGKPHLLGVVRDITERERAAERTRRLYAVTAALAEAVTSAEVARVVVDQGIAAFGATAGSLSLRSADGGALDMARSMGYLPEVIGAWQHIPLDAPIPLTDAVRRGVPIYLESPEERLRQYPVLATVRATHETQASACLPLLVGGEVMGVLAFSFDRLGAVNVDDREFMLSLSSQCAQALERARLFEAERSARAEAERASRAKDEFLAVLSHELRTPLTPVLLTVSLMESHPGLPADLREDVATIRRNVELESKLISDLLDLTRIARGKLQLDIQRVDLHLVVRSAIDICQREASARLVVELRASQHVVSGDQTRLSQIFWNVLNNAQKFTPPDGTITVRSSNPSGERIRVEVIDTGAGIDPAVLPKLFNAFEQGEVRAARQHAGLGLGLAISRRLAETQGGTIIAQSEGKGRGTTIIIEMPTVAVLEMPLPPVGKGPSGASVRPLSVLLVEDNEPTMQVLARLLRGSGHRVTAATSVAGAMAAARRQRFDLLLSDLGLPDGSGLDLMRQLRQDYMGRAIALTGYGMESDIKATRDAGFTEHLTKPIDAHVLEQVIQQVAGNSDANHFESKSR